MRASALRLALALSLTLGLSAQLAGCGVPISLDPGQNAAPSPEPSAMNMPLPAYSAPVTAPISGRPEPTPSATAEPSAAPSASASPGKDLSVSEATTLNGHVFDEQGQPVEARVSLRSVSGPVFSASAETQGGVYVFNAVPAGQPLELSAEATGYGRVSRVVVPKSNRNGDPAANRFDFGGEGEGRIYLLSQAPRVIGLSPDAGTSFAAGETLSFGLRFDRAVDTRSVEAALQISAAQDLNLGELSLERGETLLRPRQLGFDWNEALTEVRVSLPELPGLSGSLRLWLQFIGPISSSDGHSSAAPSEDFGPIWISGAPSDRHAFSFDEDEDELHLEGLDLDNEQLTLRFSKFLSFTLGENSERVHTEGLDVAENYLLQVDTDGDGSYELDLPASSVELSGDDIELGFGSLAAYEGLNARLAFDAGFLPADLAGHRLTDFSSPLLSL